MVKPLEYVASGIGLMRLNHTVFKKYPELIADVNSKTFKLNTDAHDWSYLYNAYTEAEAGHFYRKNLTAQNVYADSGGLQMITKGVEPTEPQKLKIYNHQGTHSKYAMCFDKIPVQSITEDDHISHAQARMMSYRIFDRESVKSFGKETGKNIKTQIEHFLEIGSETTPVIILHGRDEETYKTWIDSMLGEIPIEYWSKLKTVAMAASGLGVGDLEEVQKLYFATLLPKELNIKHVHLLGVGALRRMMPAIILQTNGFLKDYVISYDSTKHAMSHIMGNYMTKYGKLERLSRKVSSLWKYVYDDVQENIGLNGITFEEFFESCNSAVLGYGEKYPDKEKYPVISHYSICFGSMYNFIRILDEIYFSLSRNDFSVVPKFTKNTMLYKSLMGVKSPHDYHYWLKNVQPFLNSKKLKERRDANMGDFLF